MSRHGYIDDLDVLELGRWRGMVSSAIRGKRGQEFLRRLIAALDAMPQKELIKYDLVNTDGEVCALGATLLGSEKLQSLDPQDHESLGAELNISPCLVQEVEYENDEHGRTPQERWAWVRQWAEKHLRPEATP